MKNSFLKTLLVLVITGVLFSCNKQSVNGNAASVKENSSLKISEAVSFVSKSDRKLAYSLLSPQEKYILWVQHLENAINDPSLTQEQKGLIQEAKQFISISYFNGSKSLTDKSFDIWKYRVSQQFNEKLKARVFNEIRNNNENIALKAGGPNNIAPPADCECHDASDFCGNRNYTILFCAHTFSCEPKPACESNPNNNSGCGWFWAESCDGMCKEYVSGSC